MENSANPSPIRTAIDIAVNLLLIFVILYFCLKILTPFISLIIWAAIIAIALYKPLLKLQSTLGGNKKLALTLLTLIGLSLVIVPTWMFAGSIVESGQEIATALETGKFEISPPNESVKDWPLVGEKVYANWSAAAANFEGWLEANNEAVKHALGGFAQKILGIGVSALTFMVSILIAAAFLANAESIGKGMHALFSRLVGDRADEILKLSTATVTSVAVGVLGISLIQSFLGGVGMMVVGVPAAGLITLILLIVCIAQLPPWLVMFPVIAYVFSVESTTTASIFAVWGVIVAFLDMALKPILMGRGVDAPMLVILLGAIGGLIMMGFVGLFIGAVILAFGYVLLEAWLRMTAQEVEEDKVEAIEEN
jgi:predicted PurR-regulated permease PerM